MTIYNPDQLDADEDGYGNACDWDVNQNCITGVDDAAMIFKETGSGAPWTSAQVAAFDINDNGVVGIEDAAATFGKIGRPPGPSSRSCADCTAVSGAGVCQ